MNLRCFILRLLRFKCLLLSLAIVCLFKFLVVHKKYSAKGGLLIEPYGNAENNSRIQLKKYDIDCSAIYKLDPMEVGKSLEIRHKNIIDLEDDDIVNLTSDCQSYKELRGHMHKPLSDEEKEFPLAYSLVLHKRASMVERMLSAIYMPHNIYCLHYDQKSSKTFIAAMENIARCFPNVFIASRLESVEYAHITRLKADLNCLSDLLGSVVPWRYVINLCGQDFPLRSNFELVAELKKLQGANMLESTRPSKQKRQRFEFQHVLQDIEFDYKRIPVKTAQTKAPPPHSIKVFVGSAYFILSHEFVNYIYDSQLMHDFLSWSADTYSPDEHFWATLVRVPGVPGEIPRSEPDVTDLMSKTRLVKWVYLEGSLYPPCTGSHMRAVCIYGAAEFRWLLTYGHWFANKFDSKVDPVIVQCLEEKLEEAQRHWVNLASEKTFWRYI
ncbi:beta-1,3-galactosyl-O-glycosyl-glycoprotein beta-1,6-N-acetylglucosaminyltransferase 4-like [Paramormyrops kingsleyae]|uniref:Glucosaminyl (N-acetyl) transferase 4 n=1 Tax=Paramormyrops kingsleyae TaxID=1676925 RepID=A0A3B3Q356_9TELE|nr:beta-1,3-galactosyl-O-glycosyl-glycoprotein beta-1,6-N-acetylglucosaminyltransferase 4-like [Paramormyrops kingsleyae]